MKITSVNNINNYPISFGTNNNQNVKKQETQNQGLNFEKKLEADTVEISNSNEKRNIFKKVRDFYKQAQEVSQSVPYSVHIPYYLA